VHFGDYLKELGTGILGNLLEHSINLLNDIFLVLGRLLVICWRCSKHLISCIKQALSRPMSVSNGF
jgi:hypothetical protein